MTRLDRMTAPVIQGGMGIGISMGSLAGAVAAEGGMGVISTANIGFREEDFWEHPRQACERVLRQEIRKAKKIAGGRGLLAINAMVVTTNYDQAVTAACEEGIDAVISGAGVPLSLPEITKGFDVMIAPIVSSAKAARTICNVWKKRYDRQPDFLVIEGCEAGGHLGFTRAEAEEGTAKGLEEILAEVRNVTEVPIFVAGGIFDRADVERMLALGARGVQMATRFIATRECDATQGFKDMILQAKAEDVTILKSPVGMPGRGLKTPLIDRVEQREETSSEARPEPKPNGCIRCISTCRPDETPYCINQALIDGFYGRQET
ncbi:MAG: nitronate monooxygenase, partial [Firmicutes bacterium]|nr:nitronate monooxygenase [Bacillota bacterium]